mmetsp:Transcript_13676/g.49013  ORF Transcript_13676/g.49013 Transcript_13676/m.49013 type:complete len:313 (-) Transcript_13676:45-983(-)
MRRRPVRRLGRRALLLPRLWRLRRGLFRPAGAGGRSLRHRRRLVRRLRLLRAHRVYDRVDEVPRRARVRRRPRGLWRRVRGQRDAAGGLGRRFRRLGGGLLRGRGLEGGRSSLRRRLRTLQFGGGGGVRVDDGRDRGRDERARSLRVRRRASGALVALRGGPWRTSRRRRQLALLRRGRLAESRRRRRRRGWRSRGDRGARPRRGVRLLRRGRHLLAVPLPERGPRPGGRRAGVGVVCGGVLRRGERLREDFARGEIFHLGEHLHAEHQARVFALREDHLVAVRQRRAILRDAEPVEHHRVRLAHVLEENLG